MMPDVAALVQVGERRPASLIFDANTGFHSVICNDGLPSIRRCSQRIADE
jgi:hypothetical protein